MILRHLDLFSGIGGFSLAALLVGGIETTQFVEINQYCDRVLRKNFPGVPIHGDIKTYTPPRNRVFDIVTGGSPCQDLSVAGKKKGITGERSGLWFEQLRAFRESGATFLVWENVTGALLNGFDAVLGSLAESRHYAEWEVISASSLGAPHRRDRLFLIAYPESARFSREPETWSSQIVRDAGLIANACGFRWDTRGDSEQECRDSDYWKWDTAQVQHSGNEWECRASEVSRNFPNWDTFWTIPQPPLCGVDAGFPSRVDRITALGNTVVPHCAAIALQRVKYLHSLLKED